MPHNLDKRWYRALIDDGFVAEFEEVVEQMEVDVVVEELKRLGFVEADLG